jgi:hypothetical protein
MFLFHGVVSPRASLSTVTCFSLVSAVFGALFLCFCSCFPGFFVAPVAVSIRVILDMLNFPFRVAV